MADKINHPDHYNKNGIECIDCICAALGNTGAAEFCIGSALKYIYRHKYKDSPVDDIKKAIWYLNKWLTLTDTTKYKETTDNYDKIEYAGSTMYYDKSGKLKGHIGDNGIGYIIDENNTIRFIKPDVSRETMDNYPVKCDCGSYPMYGNDGVLYYVKCEKCNKSVYRNSLQAAISDWNIMHCESRTGCPFDESGEVNNIRK